MSFKDYLKEIDDNLSSKIFDVDNVDVEYIRDNIEAPYVKVELSTLGGKENASLIFRISLDPPDKWFNGIFQNSRYTMFHLNINGKLEQFSFNRMLEKFRKTNVKSLDEAVLKINQYLKLQSEKI